MNTAPRGMIVVTVLAVIGAVGFALPRWAGAQPAAAPDTSKPHSNAQSEAGEPRAMTSADAPAGAGENRPPAASEMPAEASQRPPSAKTSGRTTGADKSPVKPTAADKLELQTATVTGDREQPKVMYIVPWKKSDIGDLSGKPMNSLLDEALAPVDRDEFKREVMYYQAVRADASQNGAAPSPPATAR